MQPAPLTSGGLALEEFTCRGWGPHLQYSLLIKLASLSGKLFLTKLASLSRENRCIQDTLYMTQLRHWGYLGENFLVNNCGRLCMICSENTLTHAFLKSFSERIILILKLLTLSKLLME